MRERIILCFLFLGVCFLFGVPIKLYTQPGSVSVYVNGALFGISDRTGVLSELLFLNPGQYTLSAEKPGYNEITQVFDISEATSITLALFPSGLLEVRTTPQDARVLVDETHEGTGYFKKELPTGRHYVEVSAKGYQSRYFYPEVKQYFTKTLEVTLDREGDTRFITEPTEVNVSVDGKSAGVTPFQIYLEPGEHLVSFTKEWYTPQLKMITVMSQGENQVFEQLVPFSHLTIQSTPVGAKAYFNDRYVGDTPVSLSELAAEKITLSFRMEGYKEVKEEYLLNPGPQTVLTEMRLLEYPLTVTATPAALVYYDGEEKGITPLTFFSGHGTHRLSLKAGEKEWITDIETFHTKSVAVDLNTETTVLFHFIPAGEGFVLHRGYKIGLSTPINTKAGIQTFDLIRTGYPDRRRVYKLEAGKVYDYTINLEGEAALFLSTDPAEAKVYWMGAYIGDTPLRGIKVRPGTGELLVKWSGGEWVERTSLLDGQTYTLFRKLPGNTTLFVHSLPSGMPVWLNGMPSGITPLTLYVQSGTYAIGCEGPDGARQEQFVTLSGDLERTINFVFY